MIKSFSARPPHTLIIHYDDGQQRALNLEKWIDGDALHQTLKNPVTFLEVYKSPSGGAEWGHGPYLDPHIIEEMLEKQPR